MRHPGIPMPFRRTMADGTLVLFEPGVAVNLTSAQMESVLNDLGHALVMVEIDEKDRPRIDWDLTKQVRDNEKPKEPQGVAIDLSDALFDVLELNADKFGELTPVGVQAWIDAGGKLEELEGLTPQLAAELQSVLVAGMPDTSQLVEAGLTDDLIEKIVANVKGTDSQWLLDPDAIRAEVAGGFRLESLDEIGSVTARKIRKALGV